MSICFILIQRKCQLLITDKIVIEFRLFNWNHYQTANCALPIKKTGFSFNRHQTLHNKTVMKVGDH